MTTFGSFLLHPALQPLGWALLHFLWQGSGVAALLAGALWLLRRQAPQTRYLAACAALLAMALAPVLTGMALHASPGVTAPPPATAHRRGQLSSPGFPRSVQTALAIASVDVPAPDALRFASGSPRPGSGSAAPGREWIVDNAAVARAARLLSSFLPSLVAAWLIGVLLLSLRLFGAWLVVQRLPRRAALPLAGPLAARGADLARRLGIRRPVRLLQSAAVPVPAVVGCLRAVVLMPAAALAGLPPSQLEAILAHELAHIRRHDYLVNLLQTAVETLLFYHPAVWWVSHRIRSEREHCCDDLAVRALGDPITYARALTALESLRSVPASLALAGTGGDLLARIRRILGRPAEPSGMTPGWLGGTFMIALLLTAAALLPVSTASARLDPLPGGIAVAAPHTGSLPAARPHQSDFTSAQPANQDASAPAAVPHPRRVPSPHHAATEAPSSAIRSPRPAREAGQGNENRSGADRHALRIASSAPSGANPARARTQRAGAPSGSGKPGATGVVQGVSSPQIEDVAVLDLRGVPAKQVAQIKSLKDVGVLLLDPTNRTALRASLADVGATVVAKPDVRLSVEPFLEISRAALEAMPARQKLLLVGVIVLKPDVPPALVAQKFNSLDVVGILLAPDAVRGALLGKLQITGATVPLPEDAGPIVHSLGENKLDPDYLSRLQDGSIYVNVGSTQIAADVPEELLAKKIKTYCNMGATTGPAALITLLKTRCPANLGEFSPTTPPAQ